MQEPPLSSHLLSSLFRFLKLISSQKIYTSFVFNVKIPLLFYEQKSTVSHSVQITDCTVLPGTSDTGWLLHVSH